MNTYIYALTEPDTNVIRYIGKSNNPKKRLRIHLIEARRGDRFSHRANWLRKLIALEQIPGLVILEKCASAKWIDCEKSWILKYRSSGVDLVNNTDGGEGAVGYKHPRAAIDKIITTQKKSWGDPETHIRRSIAMRGIKKSGNLRKSIEFRALMSEKMKGKQFSLGYKWTQEQRERLSKALKARGNMARVPWNKGKSLKGVVSY